MLKEINALMAFLVAESLADDQNPAFLKQTGVSSYLVHYSNLQGPGSLARDVEYAVYYDAQRAARQFNYRMLDGAIVQMTYEFAKRRLQRHRLGFFPSPHLLDFQNYPEVYQEEVLYADVIAKQIVKVPLRFDYDADPSMRVDPTLLHPASHLTLGQYVHCRIPVTAPVTPQAFIEFLLRSFYNQATSNMVTRLPRPTFRFDMSITNEERRLVHVTIPGHLSHSE